MNMPRLGDVTMFAATHLNLNFYTIRVENHIRAVQSFGSLDCAFAIQNAFIVNQTNAEIAYQLSRTYTSMANELLPDVEFPLSPGFRCGMRNKHDMIYLVYPESGKLVDLNKYWSATGDQIKTIHAIARQLEYISESITMRLQILCI